MQSQKSVNNTTTDSTSAEIIPHAFSPPHYAEVRRLLNALVPNETAGEIQFAVAENALLATSDLRQVLTDAAGQPVYVLPTTMADEVMFLTRSMSGGSPGEWATLLLPPTAVLTKGDDTLALYALADVVERVAAAALANAMGVGLDKPLPLPGPAWTLAHLDDGAIYSLDELAAIFGEAPPVVQSRDHTTHGTPLDARLLTPLDLEAPELQQEMVISVGANSQSKKWRNDRMPVAKLIAILAKHPEGKQKDGPGFVLAEIVGDNRKKHAVSNCYGVGLDIDVGMPGAEIDELLRQFGRLAIRYTTFSHGKTVSKLNKDKIVRWCDQEGIDFDGDAVIRFLRDQTKWSEHILASAEYTGDVHEATGLMARISHAPMEKHRIVFPLAEAFVPSQVAKTHAQGMSMWAEVCRALARELGDLPMDNAATDPSRLFYFPRHAKGRPHETTIVGGPLFDWKTLDLTGDGAEEVDGDEFDKALAAEIKQNEKASPKSKSKTDEGKKLGRWSTRAAHGFQIADVIRDHADDRIRTPGSSKIDIECPFDEDHSNPGDPEDHGCFAVNAGDGPSDIFTIHCAHDACQGKTNLDFLGKMIKEGWFAEEVLSDDQYNIAVVEDAPAKPLSPKRPNRRQPTTAAAAVAWEDRLAYGPKGRILPTLPNLRLLIENDPRTQGVLALNVFTGAVVRMQEPGLKEGDGVLQLDNDDWRVKDPVNGDLWIDAHDHMLRAALEAPEEDGGYDLKITDRDLRAAVDLVARANSFHPVRDYLQSLTWDNRPRVESLFVTYLGTDDDAYHREIARLFMLGAVARAFEPGTKIDESVILEGVQGKRKSTFIETLAVRSEWYCDLSANFDDPKACVEIMLGKWIVELGELSGMARSDIRAAKAFLARHTDKVRLAYAHRAQEFPRGCVFMGSTNDNGYLKDPTGGRRFWPAECKIATPIDIERLRREVDQLWAEAYHLYSEMRRENPTGKLALWLSNEEAGKTAKKLQASRTIDTADDMLTGQIEEWLTREGKDRVCLREIWEACLLRDLDGYNNTWAATLGQVMRSLDGWESTGARESFGTYGQQRAFARASAPPPAEDSETAGGSAPTQPPSG